MNWFLAKLIFRIVCGDGNHIPQFDEQLRVIEATDVVKALEKARSIGYTEQHQFYNDRKCLVQWQFVNVTELHSLSAIADGAEVFSAITETLHADQYVQQVHRKASILQDDAGLSSN